MEPSRCIIDSSVFVAFYCEIDSLHTDALRVMMELSDYILIVHPYVIQETTTVLAYGAGTGVAKKFLTDITDASNVFIPSVDILHDMKLFASSGSKLSFTDIALVGLAQETGVRLVTFDRQMLSFYKR
ncbi:MAG: type II toxin-antitoxin system VapC family toxin [bacterium]|nr:type II toxin-antitoxin system VapC family toxin [bacterium]